MSTVTDVYITGSAAVLSGAFVDAAGAPSDPTDVSLTVKAPSGTETVYPAASLTHSQTGSYSYTVTLDEEGEWFYVWTGTGALPVVNQAALVVRKPYTEA